MDNARMVVNEYINSANQTVTEELLVLNGNITGLIPSRDTKEFVRKNKVTGKEFVACACDVSINGAKHNVLASFPAKLVLRDGESFGAASTQEEVLAQMNENYQIGSTHEIGLRTIEGRDGNRITLGKVYLASMDLASSATAVEDALKMLAKAGTPAASATVGG